MRRFYEEEVLGGCMRRKYEDDLSGRSMKGIYEEGLCRHPTILTIV